MSTRTVAAIVTLALAACSGGDGVAGDTPAPTTPRGAVGGAATVASTAPTASSAAITTVPVTTPESSTAVPSTPAPPDTGVPGLDSDDAFCAAWARFGGSWQVVLGAAAFGGPDESARLEVIAAPVVGDAYEAVFAAWPDELAEEEALVADQYFGVFRRRSADALAALTAAGASERDLDALAARWIDALGTRDPGDPVLVVDLPADLTELVESARTRFTAQRVAIADDPSMVIVAPTPRTDDYLATACPDQGAITGGDIVDG